MFVSCTTLQEKYIKYLLRRDLEEVSAIDKNIVSTMTIGYPISVGKKFSINVTFAWNYNNLYAKLIQISQHNHTTNLLDLKSLIFATTMLAILNQRSMQKEKDPPIQSFSSLFSVKFYTLCHYNNLFLFSITDQSKSVEQNYCN